MRNQINGQPSPSCVLYRRLLFIIIYCGNIRRYSKCIQKQLYYLYISLSFNSSTLPVGEINSKQWKYRLYKMIYISICSVIIQRYIPLCCCDDPSAQICYNRIGMNQNDCIPLNHSCRGIEHHFQCLDRRRHIDIFMWFFCHSDFYDRNTVHITLYEHFIQTYSSKCVTMDRRKCC